MNLVDQHHHDVGIAPARDVGKAKSYQQNGMRGLGGPSFGGNECP